MEQRLNRDPSYDLARHIVTGEKGPLSGSEMLRQYDAELDRNDPMADFTNVMQVADMQSGDGRLGQENVDLTMANSGQAATSSSLSGGSQPPTYGNGSEKGRRG